MIGSEALSEETEGAMRGRGSGAGAGPGSDFGASVLGGLGREKPGGGSKPRGKGAV
jgi:hypothetical protein